MDRMATIRNILGDLNRGFQKDYQIGREDAQTVFYRAQELKDLDKEAPMFDSMMGTHMGDLRRKELMGRISDEEQQALVEANMHLQRDQSKAFQAGQILGTLAGDLTQDSTRSIWWLLNAMQATGNVLNDAALKKAAPELWQRSPVMSEKGNHVIIKGKADSVLMKEAEKRGMLRENDEGVLVPSRGYSWKKNKKTKFTELHKRNYEPGMLAALAVPTGMAVNNGLGLLTPLGGAEGYKAASPSSEDPSKTNNVISEVAQKYFLGRTGNLLPYDEFKKVRPDVSLAEYKAYQADKYDNNLDLNPFDGDISLPGGAVKANIDGIHGAEVSILGRSLPVSTGVIPTASAILGTALGARYGHRSGKRGVKGGLIGGMTGVAAGTVAGSIIEGERRRRNGLENGELPLS